MDTFHEIFALEARGGSGGCKTPPKPREQQKAREPILLGEFSVVSRDRDRDIFTHPRTVQFSLDGANNILTQPDQGTPPIFGAGGVGTNPTGCTMGPGRRTNATSSGRTASPKLFRLQCSNHMVGNRDR
jgi:hypothetical protein